MWQREFGKTPSCRRSSDLTQEKNGVLRPSPLDSSTEARGRRLSSSLVEYSPKVIPAFPKPGLPFTQVRAGKTRTSGSGEGDAGPRARIAPSVSVTGVRSFSGFPSVSFPHSESNSCLTREKKSSVSVSASPYFRYTQSA